VSALAGHLPRGGRVAIGDGAGAPLGLAARLPEAAQEVGGVSLLLGWCLERPVPLPHPAFGDVRAVMGGYGLRAAIRDGSVRYVPARYGDLPGLIQGPLRPDVLLAGLVPVDGGLAFATEVGWQQAAVDSGALVLAEVNHALPRAAATPPLPEDRVVVLDEVERPPIVRPLATPTDVSREIGRRVAELIPDGAWLEVAPGEIGEAVLAALERPVSLRTGALGDGAVALHERGLLRGEPTASYVVGGADLYAWADRRAIAAGIGTTHDLAHDRFVAVNPAFEVDELGNVNAQGFGEDVLAGIGGLHDFASAAARSPHGLSVIAVPREHAGRSTLVDRLSAPASLVRCVVDVVVTEHGVADLRGRSDAEVTRALRRLWT
jgi:acyl-CoA hydrolase